MPKPEKQHAKLLLLAQFAENAESRQVTQKLLRKEAKALKKLRAFD